MFLLRRRLLLSLVLLGLGAFPLAGIAQVSLDIHIGAPPPYRFAAPPDVVVIPGSYVYTVPAIGMDVFFFSGSWYRPHEGRWFRGSSYNGPWRYCPDRQVPRAVIELPPNYRSLPPGQRRIPYGQFKKNWAAWQRDRYWDKDRAWQEGRGRPEERREGGPGHSDERRGPEHGRAFEHEDHGQGDHGYGDHGPGRD